MMKMMMMMMMMMSIIEPGSEDIATVFTSKQRNVCDGDAVQGTAVSIAGMSSLPPITVYYGTQC